MEVPSDDDHDGQDAFRINFEELDNPELWIDETVQNVPEPQIINNTDCNEGLAAQCVSLTMMGSVVERKTWKLNSPPTPSQPVLVDKNTHSLWEGDSSAQLPQHELGINLNPTEEIISGNEREAEENADNNSYFSNNQDSSDKNNDANIIHENPVFISQNPSQSISGDGDEPACEYSRANKNIDDLLVLVTVPASQEPKYYVASLANLLQTDPNKRESSDSDCLTEPGLRSPAKRQRVEEREYVSQGTQTCSPVQFPDHLKKIKTVDRAQQYDEFLKDEDNNTSCDKLLSKIEGLSYTFYTKV